MPIRQTSAADDQLSRYIDLKLAALGQPVQAGNRDPSFLDLAGPLLRNYHRKDQLLGGRLCPVDSRIQTYLEAAMADAGRPVPRLPASTFVLDRPGLARVMSLPAHEDVYRSPYLQSYRVAQGVLHNPKADRRTTGGSFHVVAGGLPVPADKRTVPRRTFVALLEAALTPPTDVLALPFTASQPDPARLFVSLLIRPTVCPATGSDAERRMEIRFFVPGSLVSNLDFVESIFGNAGDPFLPENDAALDIAHWTGHTGCVILAPHLVGLTKRALGLPHVDDATVRERRDGMCWKDAAEPYNDGDAFKVTSRDHRGVMVTVIADNYYGYCKKEVKTQISYAANLFGLAEEEHAGGALAFPAYVLGQEFYAGRTVLTQKVVFEDAMRHLGSRVDVRPERYAVDRTHSGVFYVPEDADFIVRDGCVRWTHNGTEQKLVLRAGEVYVLPWGTKIRLEKQTGGTAWRLLASRADGVLCHKPCTVSGGGKSEISKSLSGIILKGPVFVGDFQRDFDAVEAVLARDFSQIHRVSHDPARAARPILSPERSLGSVIKLLTPSPDYTETHNTWVRAIPPTIRQLIVTVKRYYRPDWGSDWRKYFSVDRSDGTLGHELKFDSQKLVGNYLRIGYDPDGSWRIYKLRPDFHPADKVQAEDDITASVVLPRESLRFLDPAYPHPSVKLVVNCETRLFQRPDDAIHRGFDRDAESDMAAEGNFFSNYEPLSIMDAQALLDRVVEFDQYSEPMRARLENFVRAAKPAYVVSSAHPRIVGGAPSKNPRYLQMRPDLAKPRDAYLAEIGTRLAREIPAEAPVHVPVNAVLAGRRNNPPDRAAGLPPLAVYGPIHYQELPELFMEFMCSLTGKSPSTTGFGSEGALTKAPFNALWPVIDVNNALVSFVVAGYGGFTTAAGYIGPHFRVDHDNSMLVPEVWCRMRVFEREPAFLVENGFLESVQDFEYDGRRIEASRLGYRITAAFVDRFLGRIFEMPAAVFPEELLRPERQDVATFVEGMEAIVEAERRVALQYFEDGSIEAACPPVRALLHVMAHGHYEGLTRQAPEFRRLFTREAVLDSDWYQSRLVAKQQRDIALWRRHVAATGSAEAQAGLARVSEPMYLESLRGTIGADPSVGP